jgi:ribosome-associated protein
MKAEMLRNRYIESEFVFSTSRSGGPGGQNVNKVNTRVELRFNILNSSLLTSEEKGIICEKLKNRINNEGELIITSQSGRTQLLNKKSVVEKFFDLVAKALTIKPYRRPTRPTLRSESERLYKKKKKGTIKKLRKSLDENDNQRTS